MSASYQMCANEYLLIADMSIVQMQMQMQASVKAVITRFVSLFSWQRHCMQARESMAHERTEVVECTTAVSQ
jgi:hypothetical protein